MSVMTRFTGRILRKNAWVQSPAARLCDLGQMTYALSLLCAFIFSFINWPYKFFSKNQITYCEYDYYSLRE